MTLINPLQHLKLYKVHQLNTSKIFSQELLVDQYKNYNVQLNDKWVMEGATAVLKCVVNPYYVKDYVQVIGWTQRNHPIVAGGRISILPSGELHIRDVRKADGLAMYSCRSKNILTGDERGSAFATLHVHDPPASDTRPTIDTFLPELTLSESSTAELPCVSSQALPYPQYTWSKNGVPVMIDNNRVLQNGGNLMIKDAITKDSGDYKCNATNRRGTETISTRLTITSTLSAIVSPPEQTVDAGLTATYNCSTSGYPINSVTWYKDGKPLVVDERVYILADTTLIIRDVKRQDQGMYQCFLANQKEVTQGTAQLTLGAAKPTILDSFQEQFVKNGQQVSLRCKATGNPIPAVKWRLDGADLPLDDRIKSNTITTLDGYVISFVNISRVKVEDGGEYSCHATSDVGYAEYMNRLNVYGAYLCHLKPHSEV
ncbi:hypothetical protein LOTGIDRAFT_163887 [Lottia gigantea]|uniref:Ig-like domain-containing protein n=1 Tax=Lottia gigantea TaxID=225164 RepID=V4A1W0_LOTGI|nr:hypothetical protein LOTGIDRAFT_163887 [Lottia gigantea]ESO90667.1 hypothetical protein LOTGIDRAFT_163887 [Lottia gigantea]